MVVSRVLHRISLFVPAGRRFVFLLALSGMMIVVIFGCHPDDVTVKRTPNSASSVANIQTSQFEQVVPFPEPDPILPREPLEDIEEEDLSEEIAANSEEVISRFGQLAKIELECNAEGIRWLSQYIDEGRNRWRDVSINNLVDTLGSFYGECLRKECGGQWFRVDGRVELRIRQDYSVYPFQQIRSHIEQDSTESILNAYQQIMRSLNSNGSRGVNES